MSQNKKTTMTVSWICWHKKLFPFKINNINLFFRHIWKERQCSYDWASGSLLFGFNAHHTRKQTASSACAFMITVDIKLHKQWIFYLTSSFTERITQIKTYSRLGHHFADILTPLWRNWASQLNKGSEVPRREWWHPWVMNHLLCFHLIGYITLQ